jgi:N-acetylmuramoyl-L-alanine amidase
VRLCVNAGHHPAHDPGAVGPTGLHEAEVTTRLAHALVPRLDALPGVFAYAKRQLGGPATLGELCSRVNASGAQVFIALHCNASANRRAHGPQVYVPRLSADRRHGALARLLLGRLPGSGSRWSRVIGAWFCVLRRVRAVRVLVETDFISCPEVEARMRDDGWIEQVVEAQVEAVRAFLAGGLGEPVADGAGKGRG